MPRDPRVERKRTLCHVCGSRFNPDEGFVGVHLSRGRTAAEQLEHGRVFYLCSDHGEQLCTFLGIRPMPSESGALREDGPGDRL